MNNGDVRRIIDLRMKGIQPRIISEMTGKSQKTIYRVLAAEKKNRGIIYPRLPHRDCKWTAAKLEDLAQQLRTRKQKEIAQEENVSAPMISQLMRKRAIMIKEAYVC